MGAMLSRSRSEVSRAVTAYVLTNAHHTLPAHISSGINAISGLPRTAQSSEVPPDFQDYVVAGQQPWLDGICTEPGVVRQV